MSIRDQKNWTSVGVGTVLLLLGNLLADIALVMVDPRVDFSSLSAD